MIAGVVSLLLERSVRGLFCGFIGTEGKQKEIVRTEI